VCPILTVFKETLYEKSLQLMNEQSKLQNQRQQLESQLKEVEEEKYKYQKQIADVEKFVHEKKGEKVNGKQVL